MQQHKITYCSAELSYKCAEKSDVSQQRHNGAHNSHEQIFLLSVFCENIFASEAMLSSRAIGFLQSAATCVAATRLNKRLLFVIYVVAVNFISFKPERKRSCNLPW